MSFNVGSPSPMQPLSLGNVVSAAVQLYRSHFKSYIQLASIAYLWIFIPIYGWAKLLANLALISRLAFGELVNQPEPIKTGQRFVNSRLWQFLVMGLLMTVINIILVAILMIPLLFMIIGFSASGIVLGNNGNGNLLLWSILFSIILIPILLIIVLWVKARFLLVEVPLAVEDNVDGVSTLGRTWDLTNRYVWRMMLILLVGYLITIPLQIPFSIVSGIVQTGLYFLIKNTSVYSVLSFMIRLIFSLASAILVVPFWQSIKAVIYYDLRTRREGLGLRLRDNDI